ncbi:MAG: hypothetical protein ACPGJV_04015 [Bacteriovoracaceae bacterium]
METKHLRNQKGQGVLEYIIISSLIGILCLGVVKGFGDTLETKLKNMREAISKRVKINTRSLL